MSDLSHTTKGKADQLNWEDLSGYRSKTIMITGVSVKSGEQPVSISYQGDDGKPYKPGLTMRRVIVAAWGPDGNGYIGRSLTLVGDDSVKMGGAEVGGLRITHMSNIASDMAITVTVSKGRRARYAVKKLTLKPTLADFIAEIEKAETLDELKAATSKASKAFGDDESRTLITRAKDKRKEELSAPPGDGSMFGGGKPEDTKAIKG